MDNEFDHKKKVMKPSILLYSMFYLLVVCTYNLQTFNTITTSSNWFVHPIDGGCCVFGQFMAVLTCLFLLYSQYSCNYKINQYLLGIVLLGWMFIPHLMNNDWLSIQCLPLCLLWCSIILS